MAFDGHAFVQTAELNREGRRTFGDRPWRLLMEYGLVLAGDDRGKHVGQLHPDELRVVVLALSVGSTLPIHLMHRQEPGIHEWSELRWSRKEGLVMVFEDREEAA